MAIPERAVIKEGLIRYILKNGGPSRSLRPTEIYDGLASQFSLTQEDRAIRRVSESFWENEVRWARQELVEEGYILGVDHSQYGVWTLPEGVNDYSSGQYQSPKEPKSSRIKEEFPEINAELKDKGVFSPSNLSDARDIVLRAIVQRRGQSDFRAKLLQAYGFCCCVTEETALQVLEAAHIVPYRGEDTNHIQNGLLLRSDIHTLFDLHLLAIEPNTLKVVLSPELKKSSYANLMGKQIRTPDLELQKPSLEALKNHRESCHF